MNRLLYATRSRRAVLELLRRERRYLTASEIHRRLAIDQPKLAISTIYRTLEMLEGLGTIARRADPDGEASFVYCGERPHHHAVCRVCGRVDEVACDAIDEIRESLESERGFELDEHTIEFFGRCATCRSSLA